jgi:hypothetical protein
MGVRRPPLRQAATQSIGLIPAGPLGAPAYDSDPRQLHWSNLSHNRTVEEPAPGLVAQAGIRGPVFSRVNHSKTAVLLGFFAFYASRSRPSPGPRDAVFANEIYRNLG